MFGLGLFSGRSADAIYKAIPVKTGSRIYQAKDHEPLGKSCDHAHAKMGMNMQSHYEHVALKEFGDEVEADKDDVECVPTLIDLPLVNDDVLLAMLDVDVGARSEREFYNAYGTSGMYDDVKASYPACAFFPRHRANDKALYLETFKKRVVHSSIDENERSFVESEMTGMLLFMLSCDALGVPEDLQEFDEDLFMSCLTDQINKRVEGKSANLLDQYEDRSVAWLDQFRADVRMKGQLKAKLEALALEEPKAGQTINVLPEWVFATYGVWVRYLTAMIERHKTNSHVNFHGGRSMDELSEMVKRDWKKDPALRADEKENCTINDYTAFGASQGGESLQMDTMWYAWCGMPESLIARYVELKTQLRVGGGVKVISRDDGEADTYNGNCRYNIALCAARFGVEAMWRGCWWVAGDDMVVDHEVPTDAVHWAKYEHRVRTLSKLQYTPVGDFCGWIMAEDYGLIRDPLVLYYKVLAKTAHGALLSQFIGSYAIELRRTYEAARMGASLDSFSVLLTAKLLDIIHSKLPILSTILFGKQTEHWLERLQRKVEYWTGKSFRGRKNLLRQARALISKELSGKDMRRDCVGDYEGSREKVSLISNTEFIPPPPNIEIKCLLYAYYWKMSANMAIDGSNRAAPRFSVVNEWNANVRRVTCEMSALTPGVALTANTSMDSIGSWIPHINTDVQNFARGAMAARIVSAEVLLIPSFLAVGGLYKVSICTYDAEGTAPTTDQDFMKQDTVVYEVAFAASDTGMPPMLRIPITFGEFGIGELIAPRPVQGFRPAIAFKVTWECSQALAAHNTMGQLLVQAMLERQ